MSDLVRVAVDAMGGDYAPAEPVKGAVEAVNADERVKVQLVGQVDVIEKELQKYTYPKERVEIVPATEIIETGEPPVNAIRHKKDSSIVVGMKKCATERQTRLSHQEAPEQSWSADRRS